MTPIAWKVVIARENDSYRGTFYYDYDTPWCPLNNDGTWKPFHPGHYRNADRSQCPAIVISMQKLFAEPQA